MTMKLKKKTPQLIAFINEISKQISECLEGTPVDQSEGEDQKTIDGALGNYLRCKGVNTKKHYFWKKKKDSFKGEFPKFFASKNVPDFVILDPYLVAIEYKKHRNKDHGATAATPMKNLIGESIIHIYSGGAHYVLGFFRDATTDGRIHNSIREETNEKQLVEGLQENQNIFLRVMDDSEKTKKEKKKALKKRGG